MSKVSIIGTGSWGCAMGRHLATKWDNVTMWGIEQEQVDSINETHMNPDFLGAIRLPHNLTATGDLKVALRDTELVFIAVPSQVVRKVAARIVPDLPSGVPVINLSKGLELATLKPLSKALHEEINGGSEAENNPIGVMMGPSHAEEVARDVPTAIVLAGRNESDWIPWQERLSGLYLRVYTNPDLVGVEFASSFKNVIALAVGMCDGLEFGDNTRGALMTRGMHELSRVGVALGARIETFFGLAGIGDMITTCTSRHSRNRNFGELIGRGVKNPEAALAQTVQVVEGVVMTQAALKLGAKLEIELPITKQVHDVLFSGKLPIQAMRDLMERVPKSEAQV